MSKPQVVQVPNAVWIRYTGNAGASRAFLARAYSGLPSGAEENAGCTSQTTVFGEHTADGREVRISVPVRAHKGRQQPKATDS